MLFLFFIFPIFHLTTAQTEFWDSKCGESGNYTMDSTYKKDLDDIIYNFTERNNGFGYYRSNFKNGSIVALCRGDVEPEICRRCVDDATRQLRKVCPAQREAAGWYDNCFLWYSGLNKETEHLMIEGTRVGHDDHANSYHQWNETLRPLLDKLRPEAAGGGPYRKYASGNSSAPGFSTLYGIMQCIPDISAKQCDDCLLEGCRTFELYDRITRVRVYKTSCVIRYQHYKFFNPTWFPAQAPPPPPPPTSSGNSKSTRVGLYVGIGVGVVVAIIIIVLLLYLHRKRNRRVPVPQVELSNEGQRPESESQVGLLSNEGQRPESESQVGLLSNEGHGAENESRLESSDEGSEPKTEDDEDAGDVNSFSLSTIQVATNNFALENKVGEGGFGPVYKGVLQDGKEIAVKRLSRNSKQGSKEFKTEVKLIMHLQHKNLVRLLGYCAKGPERILIYEFMNNNSLDTFLFDADKCKELDWAWRSNIGIGIAKGLRYLHDESRLKIVHRDLKTSNILLDNDMNAVISDFGTARVFGSCETQASTTKIIGSFGYMAPEYAMRGLYSTNSDVYSFGMVLLEIISGRIYYCASYPDEFKDLLLRAWNLWNDNKPEKLIDGRMVQNYSVGLVLRWINIALLCVQEDSQSRPGMSEVVSMLEDQWTPSLPSPSEPQSSMTQSMPPDGECPYIGWSRGLPPPSKPPLTFSTVSSTSVPTTTIAHDHDPSLDPTESNPI